MPYALVGHDLHAAMYRVVRTDRDDRSAHDLADLGVVRRTTIQDYFARVVAFGHDADQLVALHHEQSPDMIFGHDPDGMQNGIVDPDG